MKKIEFVFDLKDAEAIPFSIMVFECLWMIEQDIPWMIPVIFT